MRKVYPARKNCLMIKVREVKIIEEANRGDGLNYWFGMGYTLGSGVTIALKIVQGSTTTIMLIFLCLS